MYFLKFGRSNNLQNALKKFCPNSVKVRKFKKHSKSRVGVDNPEELNTAYVF